MKYNVLPFNIPDKTGFIYNKEFFCKKISTTTFIKINDLEDNGNIQFLFKNLIGTASDIIINEYGIFANVKLQKPFQKFVEENTYVIRPKIQYLQSSNKHFIAWLYILPKEEDSFNI